ncbi:MAG: hypothetical protein H6557_02145 [Lewinellaceae bacterium]|nr:hypothetical protein [Lewinellaceae bacterium]
MTEVEVDVVNQYYQVTGTRTDTVVVRVIPWDAPTRLVSGIPAGSHYFRYRVEDGCGNKVIVYCPFTVADLVEPTAICDDNLHVSIGGADFARIFAEDVDEGSNDNCNEVSLAVRRSGVVLLDQFGRVIPFICGSQVSPWGTVRRLLLLRRGSHDNDRAAGQGHGRQREHLLAGHRAGRESEAVLLRAAPGDDQLRRAAVQLRRHRHAATAAAVRGRDFGGQLRLVGRELPPVPDLECGSGTIIRRFRATDVNRNESVNTCTQVVTIKEVHNFEIKFPADAEAVCGAADPDSVIYEEIGCDLLAVNHTDEFFSASGDECYKIFRKWKVINWCQYDGQSGTQSRSGGTKTARRQPRRRVRVGAAPPGRQELHRPRRRRDGAEQRAAGVPEHLQRDRRLLAQD